MKKALITGHLGFVGQYFIEALSESYDITGIDIKENNDIRDFLKTNNEYYDLVVHLAAIVGGRQTIENQPLSVGIDLSIDSEFFNWVLKNKPGHTIYFSSSAAYPIKYQYANSKIALSEHMIDLDNIMSPDFTYGWSKLTGEYLAKFVQKEYENITIFRPFSGYGTDQDLSYPFPSFIHRAKNLLNPFDIWGDGQQVRDFIHIRDIIQACLVCVDKKIYGTYNLGTGIPVSFNVLAKLVTQMTGYSPEYNHIPTAPTGVMYRVSNPAKMLKFYTPKITLKLGIQRALEGIV